MSYISHRNIYILQSPLDDKISVRRGRRHYNCPVFLKNDSPKRQYMYMFATKHFTFLSNLMFEDECSVAPHAYILSCFIMFSPGTCIIKTHLSIYIYIYI